MINFFWGRLHKHTELLLHYGKFGEFSIVQQDKNEK